MQNKPLSTRLTNLHDTIGAAEKLHYVEGDSKRASLVGSALATQTEGLESEAQQARGGADRSFNQAHVFAPVSRAWTWMTGRGRYAAAIAPFAHDEASAKAAILRLSLLQTAINTKPGLAGHVEIFDADHSGSITTPETHDVLRELGVGKKGAVAAANAIVLGLAPKTKADGDERGAGKVILHHLASKLGLGGQEAAVFVDNITGGRHPGDQGFNKDGTIRERTIEQLKAEAGDKDFVNEKDLFRAMRRTMMEDPEATARDAAVSVLELFLWMNLSPFTDPSSGERVLHVKGNNDQIGRFYANQDFNSIIGMRMGQKFGGRQLADALGADPKALTDELNLLPVITRALSFAIEIGKAKKAQAKAS